MRALHVVDTVPKDEVERERGRGLEGSRSSTWMGVVSRAGVEWTAFWDGGEKPFASVMVRVVMRDSRRGEDRLGMIWLEGKGGLCWVTRGEGLCRLPCYRRLRVGVVGLMFGRTVGGKFRYDSGSRVNMLLSADEGGEVRKQIEWFLVGPLICSSGNVLDFEDRQHLFGFIRS